MNSLKRSVSGSVCAATALFLAATQGAFAQGAAAAPHQHHLRYIIGGAVVVIVIVLIVLRMRNAKKQAA